MIPTPLSLPAIMYSAFYAFIKKITKNPSTETPTVSANHTYTSEKGQSREPRRITRYFMLILVNRRADSFGYRVSTRINEWCGTALPLVPYCSAVKITSVYVMLIFFFTEVALDLHYKLPPDCVRLVISSWGGKACCLHMVYDASVHKEGASMR